MPMIAAPAAAATVPGPAYSAANAADARTTQARATDTSAAPSGEGPVAVFGIPGLSTSDLDPETTPNLWSLAERGAAGNMTVRGLGSATCPGDGWMTLGAGARAGYLGTVPGPNTARCAVMGEPYDDNGTQRIVDWNLQVEENAESNYHATPGNLSETLEADGRCVTAIGPGAALAGARADGSLGTYAKAGSDLPAESCDLTLVDLGAIGTGRWVPDAGFTTDAAEGRAFVPDEEPENGSYLPPLVDGERPRPSPAPAEHTMPIYQEAPSHGAQLRAADEALGRYLSQLSEDTTVVVAGLGDSSSTSRLRSVVIAPPKDAPGLLTSASTRRDGLVQLTDLSPTVLRMFGLERPADMVGIPATAVQGSPIQDDSAEERLLTLEGEAKAAATIHKSTQTFSILLDIVFYLLAIALGLLLYRAWRHRPAANLAAASDARARWLGWLGLGLGAVPIGSFLAGLLPWSRAAIPELGLGLAVLAGTLAALVPVVLGPWRRTWAGRAAALGGVVALVLGVDVATGSNLQLNSLMGYNAIVAGRFYGLGNQAVAIYIVATLLSLSTLAAWLRARGRSGLGVALAAVLGLAAIVVLGNPAWGAKFGGTIAMLLGWIVLVLMLMGVRLNVRRLLVIGVVSLAILVGVAGLDYLRPAASRSHFGLFFGQLLSGEMLGVVSRKLDANLSIISVNPMIAIVVPIGIAVLALILSWLTLWPGRPRLARLGSRWAGRLPSLLAEPAFRAGLVATVLALLTGMVITDSGVAVPATGFMLLVPLLLTYSAGTALPEPAEGVPAAAAADGRDASPRPTARDAP